MQRGIARTRAQLSPKKLGLLRGGGELAENAPTLVYVHVRAVCEHVLVAMRDQRPPVREAAAHAVSRRVASDDGIRSGVRRRVVDRARRPGVPRAAGTPRGVAAHRRLHC